MPFISDDEPLACEGATALDNRVILARKSLQSNSSMPVAATNCIVAEPEDVVDASTAKA